MPISLPSIAYLAWRLVGHCTCGAGWRSPGSHSHAAGRWRAARRPPSNASAPRHCHSPLLTVPLPAPQHRYCCRAFIDAVHTCMHDARCDNGSEVAERALKRRAFYISLGDALGDAVSGTQDSPSIAPNTSSTAAFRLTIAALRFLLRPNRATDAAW
ncbi:hypothetical protein BU26DRAFT_206403 [Trematosphaeria pertusa]|uniref:Uncharacterized protein n=1 Tax=Trematosphaeria pertusa TaxID=390896 RepID=A0A6A6HSI2_9PLEO|nr:uncharacterized protein BU26DRAFT_206403 [Trematosphaeria pertusa]KAF2240483.1 hypothetical protein BU26DRAFT_206403 [Trematosphaeria pertusa]